MATIRETVLSASARFTTSDSARLDAELLLAKVLGKERSYLFTWPEKNLTSGQFEDFSALVVRREAGEPVSYLLGTQSFWSLELQVNNATLIPRPETEVLVEAALQLPQARINKVLDLGTGTGAIALALASERPLWKVSAVDSQQPAVLLAIENCRRLGFTNVEISRSDWFSNLAGQKFDLIVSNPPYIDSLDPHLEQGDVRYEPRSALVSEEKGLADLRRIIETAPAYLNAGAWLMLEHGYNQGDDVRSMLAHNGFVGVATQKDLNGQDRVTIGQFA